MSAMKRTMVKSNRTVGMIANPRSGEPEGGAR